MVRLALLPSPLLGPAVWAPVAGVLADQGVDVLVPPAYDGIESPDDVVAHLLRVVPETAPVVLVPHSNAGLYVAALAARRDVRGLVFVDARLPAEGSAGRSEPGFRDFLGSLAGVDGRLPGWTRWWPPEELTGLFPDDATRARVEAEQARLPLSYFDATVPAPSGWQRIPAAYLSFGDTYASERARAAERGWPTAALAGRHLHQLVDPTAVGGAILGLLGRMGLVEP